MFDFVCDRLGSPSDLVKSWGGECDGRMRSTSAGNSGINTAVRDCMVTLVLACRGTMLYIVCVLQA